MAEGDKPTYIRIPHDVVEALTESAAESRRPLTQEIVFRLVRDLKRTGKLKEPAVAR